MVPWTDHSAPEGWMVVPLNETELGLTSSMRAVIPVKPVTTPASKLTINPILVIACGFSRSSAFIVPSHDTARTSALTGKAEINAKATNSMRGMACSATAPNPHIRPMASAYQIQPTRAEVSPFIRSPRRRGQPMQSEMSKRAAVTQFGRPPVLGSNEQIFGVNGQILGRDHSD